MILDDIAARTRARVRTKKREKSYEAIQEEAEKILKTTSVPSFYKALLKEDISFICEVKKASPSKGVIAENFPYLSIAEEYEEAGASAVSVLTEPYYFQGKDEYLKEIASKVRIPALRKDFILDPWQIYEARTLGASAVLLIVSLLEKEELGDYLDIAAYLGMDALVEAHTEEEVEKALAAGAKIIGVNNRDLKTFEVDLRQSIRLRELVPEGIPFVAESGIRTPEDVAALRKCGVNGVLIGETFMRSQDKKQALTYLRGKAETCM